MNPPRTLCHFVWQDYLTPNIDKALSYFDQLVNWKVFDKTWPNIGRYPTILSEAGAIAGILEQPKFLQDTGVPPYWTGYVETNIASAEEQIPKLGGQLFTMPVDSPMGKTFVFTDPGGAVLAAYELSHAFVIPSSSKPNEFVWQRLYSGDNGKSRHFYDALFGWEFSSDGANTFLDRAGAVVADMTGQPSWIDQDTWVYFLGVESLAETVSAMESHGGSILDTTKIQDRDAVVSRDSQGGVIGFVQWE
ncbi:MAG: hypothetical protein AAF541_21695 [Pseudomonadota bacterium]